MEGGKGKGKKEGNDKVSRAAFATDEYRTVKVLFSGPFTFVPSPLPPTPLSF